MTALIYCPFPNEDSAKEIGRALIEEGLIGCINVGPSIHSLFVRNSKIGESEETPALLKTDKSLLQRAISRLEILHPYDTPAILGWPCVAGSATTDWLGQLGSGANE
ncbi:divalent-cation tolerance protein CutA [Qipengyuania seohaensis]|uniref:divalent-cation tolerance protein CutA n=1 Tax=Qipengyuania seohaensis TaxID=266951 RepID=UPI000C21EDEE|nr:divalent-cation tolerance protein CutA [Qipengyuania seohaensis]